MPGTSLSADKKVLTLNHPGFQLNAREAVNLSVILVSDADNTRSGVISDGVLTSVAGGVLPTGTTTAISYVSAYSAAPAPVEFTGATTDANPVFSGTGIPGATITITLPDGRVLGTTIVTPEGAWSVPSDVELTDGEYTFTATQTGTGVTESSDTITVTVVGAPIADPMIAGGAGMALLAGAGAVFAIRRRRAAQA